MSLCCKALQWSQLLVVIPSGMHRQIVCTALPLRTPKLHGSKLLSLLHRREGERNWRGSLNLTSDWAISKPCRGAHLAHASHRKYGIAVSL